ncbi:MAG: hypothetical protein H6622_14000 [Halobacteriovoraceae bacterium]|nr:hypothetical protein [Halobacteriovoraceae bacterium]
MVNLASKTLVIIVGTCYFSYNQKLASNESIMLKYFISLFLIYSTICICTENLDVEIISKMEENSKIVKNIIQLGLGLDYELDMVKYYSRKGITSSNLLNYRGHLGNNFLHILLGKGWYLAIQKYLFDLAPLFKIPNDNGDNPLIYSIKIKLKSV